MVVFPNAKINIGLAITGKRGDGYHNIESCFYPVGWCDALEAVESDALSFVSSGIPIPGKLADNLCVKAYKIVRRSYDIPPVSIHLHKMIPIGAGLGGGSSDGTFMIRLLNDLFGLGMDEGEMESLALELGSDCPFFIRNKARFVSGRGEIFSDIRLPLESGTMVIVNPGVAISTGEAYSGIKTYSPTGKLKPALENSAVADWKDAVGNDFEAPIFGRHPEIRSIKEKLYEMGALYASMSGSGASVYGIFPAEANAREWFPASYSVWEGPVERADR